MANGEWRLSFRLAAQDAFVRFVFGTALVLVILTSAYFILRILPEALRSGVMTMHYSVYLGIDDVRKWTWLFVAPGIALTVMVMDGLAIAAFYRRDRLASRALAAVSLISAILWAVGAYFLIVMNL